MNPKTSLIEVSKNQTCFKLGLLALAGLFLMAMTRQPAPVQTVSTLEVVRSGQVIATLGGDERGGRLDFFTASGSPAFSLRIGQHGGADLILGQGETRKQLTFSIQGAQLRIAEHRGNHVQVIYRSFQPGLEIGTEPSEQPDRREMRAMDNRLKHLDGTFDDLRREFDRLQTVMRDRNPGITDRNNIDRLARSLEDVSREQNDLEREIRTLNDELRSSRTDRNDLRRMIRRLESRIK